MDDKDREATEVVKDLLDLVSVLMPGVAHIALQDYKVLNDVPVRANAWLHKMTAKDVCLHEIQEAMPIPQMFKDRAAACRCLNALVHDINASFRKAGII